MSGAATTPKLALSTKTAGATCNNANPTDPICSGLAAGDVVTATGSGFTDGSLASIVQCNSDTTQPVLLFLGTDVPVSCSPLALTSISSTGTLSGTHTLTTGRVGPPITGGTPTCTQTVPKTSVITGCTTSGNATTDAAEYPCPPTTAQQAAGDTCVLAIGDQAGDRAVGTILFGTETLPTTTTTTKPGSTTTAGPTTTAGGPTTTTGSTTTTTGSTTTTTSTTSTTTTTTSPTSTATATQVSTPSVTLGPAGTVSDTVTVRGSATNGSPSGNVNFYVCQTGTAKTVRGGPCAATSSAHLATAHLTAGAGDTATASSGSFTPTSTGTWCFSAVYAGDSPYTGSTENTSSTNLDPDECALVGPSPSTMATFISSAKLSLGPLSSASDTVTVRGNVVARTPTGTVSFYVCHTSTALTLAPGPCLDSGTPEDAGVALLTGAGASSAAASSVFIPTSVGTWCFSAVYSGSPTYATSGDNTSSANLDPDECMLVAPPSGDAITSSPNASGRAGFLFSFLVTTSGSPTPTLKRKGKLPKGVKFVNNHNGTATISGIPALTKGVGVFTPTITATFGKGKTKRVVTQTFTLSIT